MKKEKFEGKTSFMPYTETEIKSLIKEVFSEIRGETSITEKYFEEDYLTQSEAAIFLKVSLPTLIKWKKERKIPYYQMGRTIKFKKSELLEAMKRNDNLIK